MVGCACMRIFRHLQARCMGSWPFAAIASQLIVGAQSRADDKFSGGLGEGGEAGEEWLCAQMGRMGIFEAWLGRRQGSTSGSLDDACGSAPDRRAGVEEA